jgi:hypothetical protein
MLSVNVRLCTCKRSQWQRHGLVREKEDLRFGEGERYLSGLSEEMRTRNDTNEHKDEETN